MIEEGNQLRWEDNAETDGVTVYFNGNEALRLQHEIMLKALKVYDQRNVRYKDNWRRFGWRGCLFRIRERVERAWDDLWDYDPDDVESMEYKIDDLIDMINFVVFAVRAVQGKNRDGEGGWW